MLIPHRQLSIDALHGIVDEVITREGTDYGDREFSLAAKRNQVLAQLESGKLFIVFDESDGSVNLVGRNDWEAG